MNLASLHSEYIENPDIEINDVSLEDKNLDITDILEHFYTLNNTLKDKEYTEKATEVFKLIPMRMESFYEKFDEECMEVPILKYYDPHQLFQRISCASNEDIMLIKDKLVERARKYNNKLTSELKNIEKLNEILTGYLEGKEINIKTVILNEFKKDLEYVEKKYKEN